MSTLAFRTALEHLINQHSQENGSDTPDFVLAEYLVDCLQAFDRAIASRDKLRGPRYIAPGVDGTAPSIVPLPEPPYTPPTVEARTYLSASPTVENVNEALSTPKTDKQQAAQWARDLLAGEFVIFDTETTGFDADDEIIQIGIINQAGDVVLEQLIKPTKSIQNSQYHGITDDLVKAAPGFPDVYEQIKAALQDKVLVAYNYEYDSRMLAQVCRKHGLEVPTRENAYCAMIQYAQFNGDWNDYHGNYRWVKLREALAAFGLKHTDFGTKEHDACTDARATLALIKKMAEYEAEKPAATEK